MHKAGHSLVMAVFLNPHYGTPGLVVLPAGGWRRALAFLTAQPDLLDGSLVAAPDWARTARVERAMRYMRYEHAGSIVPAAFAYGATQALLAAVSRAGQGGDPAAITLASDDLPALQRAAAQLGCQCATSPDDAEWVSTYATPGYTEIPRDIMQAYRWAPERARAQWEGAPPTHIVVPGGDGLLAAAVSVHLRPWAARLIVHEPVADSPLMAHAMGQPGRDPGLLVWQELERAAFAYVAGPVAPHGAALGLGPGSRVLLFTETGAETAPGL